jgi:HK97 family phage major capsid protein
MSFPEIKAAIEQTAGAFAAFQKTADARAAELLDRIEELESRRAAPGRTGPGATAPLPETTDTLRTADGERVEVLRKGSDFTKHYPTNSEGLTLADLMRGVARMKTSESATNALSVGTGSAGGYAVPTVLMPGILEALVPASSILSAGGGMIDVSATPGKTFDFAAVDTIPTAAWRSEAGAVAESDPAFRTVTTTPRSLSFYFKVSRELLADAPNIDAALRTTIAQAFAKELDRVGLRGTGSAPEPHGILGTTGVNTVTNGAAGASLATTAYANFMSAVQAILEDDAPMPTAAIMSPRSLVVLGGLLDTANQPRARPEMLRGMQFIASSQIPNNLTVTTSSDCSEIYVGDFGKMAFVLREAPSIQLATELFAANGQVAFVCHARADVALMYPKAFATVTGVRP